MTTKALYKIGALAKLSGVSAKTIRFYSDIGALPPTAVTEAGYRLYSDQDRSRLETIRALRELGLDLSTIIALLRDNVSVTAALAVQLDALDLLLHTVRRQRALLKAALAQGEPGALAYLDRAQAQARFDAQERQAFLAARITTIFAGVNADPDWQSRFLQAATLDLPDELNEAQFTAWLELADLLSDDQFLQRMNTLGREWWQPRDGATVPPDIGGMLNTFYCELAEALKAGFAPTDPQGQGWFAQYLALQAAVLGRGATDPAFPADLLAMIERHTDPRAARYWELLAILKDWPPSPIAAAHEWLVAALRARVATQ